MASQRYVASFCCCKSVGSFPLANEMTRLEYPKWKRDIKNQKDQVVYNMGCGITVDNPDDAMEKFFERDFQDIQNCNESPHSFKCIPDSIGYHSIVTKIPKYETERENINLEEKETMAGKEIEESLINKLRKVELEESLINKLRKVEIEEKLINKLRKVEIEESLINKLRNAFKTLEIKNTVMISGFQEKSKNDSKLEIDLLIICKDSKTIIQIESKNTFGELTIDDSNTIIQNAFDNSTKNKVFKNLDEGYNYFNSKIPFVGEHGWKFVKVVHFQQDWNQEEICEGCRPFVLTPNSDIFEWLKIMKVCNANNINGSGDPTYLLVLKFIFYQMYQQEDCSITQDDILQSANGKNVLPQKIFFFNKVQFDLLNGNEDCKRVALMSPFGTGQTTLLKEKARRLLMAGQKVTIIVFKDMLLRGEALLFQNYKAEFGGLENARCIQIPGAVSSVNDNLMKITRENAGCHLIMDELPFGACGLTSKTLKQIAQDPLHKDSYFWFACQGEDAPDKSILKGYFYCPDMILPLRYTSNLLKLSNVMKDIKGGTSFPTKETNTDVYFNQGPRAIFFTVKRFTDLACAVEQVVHILQQEKTTTLIKIHNEQRKTLLALRNSKAAKRLIVLEDPDIVSEDIMTNLTEDKILVVTSKDNYFFRGYEFSTIVHFTQSIDGDQIEMIYSRCKSKLILVCIEDFPPRYVPKNSNCEFAKNIPICVELLPQTLENAIISNNSQQVLDYFSGNVPIDATNTASQTGLMIACMAGALDVVEAFLDKGANLDSIDFMGWTLVHHAAKNGCLDVMKKVTEAIESKCSAEEYRFIVAMETNENKTALHIAAEEGHLEVVIFLLGKNVIDVDSKTNLGTTPLHLASFNGYLDVVKCLAKEGGAKINSKTKNGETPLHQASACGHLDVVKYFVKECGAQIDLKNDDGWTPLHLASSNGHLDVVKYLIEEIKSDVNIKDNNGQTPLHLAAWNGNIDVVKCLVKEYGSNVNMKDNIGQTPLHHACFNGHLYDVKYLANECGAQTDLKNDDGWTPLHHACSNGHLDVVKYLIKECKSDDNMKDNNGQTPLHLASINGHLDVVKCLVKECGSDVDMKNNGGDTPLHLASLNGHLDVAKYLAKECGSDVDMMNNKGLKAFVENENAKN